MIQKFIAFFLLIIACILLSATGIGLLLAIPLFLIGTPLILFSGFRIR